LKTASQKIKLSRKVPCTLQSIARQLNNWVKFFVAISSIPIFAALKVLVNAEVAHLVEHDLAKVGVAGSSPVFRSDGPPRKRRIFFGAPVVELVDSPDLIGVTRNGKKVLKIFYEKVAPVVELVDTQDLKSCDPQRS
jgi:hypothetical protein